MLPKSTQLNKCFTGENKCYNTAQMMRNTALLIALVWTLFGGVMGVEAKAKIVAPTLTPTIVPSPTSVPILNTNITEVSDKSLTNNSPMLDWVIERGVSTNTIVLLLLLPLVATLVSVLHYLVGVSGYGIFMPTMMAVVLVATGSLTGVILFGVVLVITLLSNWLLKKWKLHFWPARAISLLLVGIGVLAVMWATAETKILAINEVSIFPILFMVLLTEEFVRTQLTKSKKEAVKLTLGTLILAFLGATIMGIRKTQELVLMYPWVVILVVIVVNILVGRYGGIRLTEIKRFKNAIRKK